MAVVQEAQDLDVHENVLRQWVRELREEPQGAFPEHAAGVCLDICKLSEGRASEKNRITLDEWPSLCSSSTDS